MKFAICDDENIELELLSKYITKWCYDRKEICEIHTFISSENFLFSYEDKNDYDLLLLDIQMKDMNGVELAKKLRAKNDEIPIIFITGISDYVFSGYEVNALFYLMKPVKEDILKECLDKAYQKIQTAPQCLICEEKGTFSKVRISDILYIESAGHDSIIYSKSMEYKSRTGIQKLSEELSSFGFYRTHRSYLVNISKIERIGKTELVVDSGDKIPIARGKWESLNQAFLEYYRREL